VSDKVAAMLAESARCAREGRMLIERSAALRAQAFEQLPVGVTLEFVYGPGRGDWDFALVKQPDGSWVNEASVPGVPGTDRATVEEWWQGGNLRVRS
jgi:hypothetical protein